MFDIANNETNEERDVPSIELDETDPDQAALSCIGLDQGIDLDAIEIAEVPDVDLTPAAVLSASQLAARIELAQTGWRKL